MGNRGTLINHKNRCERDWARREREREAGRERITSKAIALHRTPSTAVGPPSLQLLFQRCGFRADGFYTCNGRMVFPKDLAFLSQKGNWLKKKKKDKKKKSIVTSRLTG